MSSERKDTANVGGASGSITITGLGDGVSYVQFSDGQRVERKLGESQDDFMRRIFKETGWPVRW